MIQLTKRKKFLSVILCAVLIAAMALIASGCVRQKDDTVNTGDTTSTTTADTTETGAITNAPEVTKLGTGQTVFYFTVVDKDGNETKFEIHTDKTTVGDALLEHNLIAGEQGAYGLYVKTVNGITADFDVDKTYWAFYINGEYGMTGVDTTNVTAGATYTFKVEK